MSDPVTVVLLGEPVAWRHRTSPSSPGIRYLPKKQRDASAALRMAAQDAMFIGGNYAVLRPPFDVPLHMELLAEFAIPAGWSLKKRQRAMSGEIRPGKRPDLSNTLKLAEDSLNGVVFRDDSLICEHHTRKVYGVQPKLVITVRALQ